MRIYTVGNETVIDQDGELTARAAGVETETVDIGHIRPSLDELAKLYQKASVTKRPEDALAYVTHKKRILALFYKRDVLGERYE